MNLSIVFIAAAMISLLGVFSVLVFVFASLIISQISGAPYVPLPKKSLKAILTAARIGESGNFYDLGAGDGRVLLEAVGSFGVEKAVGYEVAFWPYWKAAFLVRRSGLGPRIKIFRRNFFDADLSGAKTVFMYLFPKLIQKAALKLGRELKTGARVVCISFKIENPENSGFRLIKEERADKFDVFVYEKI